MMHRKVLISIALAGTATYLVAQSAGSRTLVRSGGPGTVPSSAQVALAASKSGHTDNAAQAFLKQQIARETNYYIEKAREENREAVVSYLIEAQCYHILTLLDAKQRSYETRDFWQVDKYKPNGEWDHITAAPSKAKALLTLTPEQDKAIHAINEALWKSRLAPFNRATKELAEKGLRGQDHANAYNAWLENYWAGHPRSYRDKTAVEHWGKAMGKVRSLLTVPQQNEWDAIVAGYSIDLKQAFEGSTAPPDSK